MNNEIKEEKKKEENESPGPPRTEPARVETHTREIIVKQAEPISPDITEQMISTAKRRRKFIEVVTEEALRATTNRDWIDEEGTPYLMGSGADKVIRTFALSLWDVESKMIWTEDTEGRYYYFSVQGKVGFSKNEFGEYIGTCSSRDAFFAKRGGEYLPLSQVDIGNIEKKAYTNFIVNACGRFLGLRGLTWEIVTKITGIKKKECDAVKYHTKKIERDEETLSQEIRLRAYVLAINNENEKESADWLFKETTWEKGDKTIAGKKNLKHLTVAQLAWLFKKHESDILDFENPKRKFQDKDNEA